MVKRKLKNILIAGDSFSSVWPDGNQGWPCFLANDYNIINMSQAGVGEYKIFKQVCSVDLNNFDLVIVSHTSPSRVHTINHPIHKTGFHKNCDLIYTDIEDRFDLFNENLKISKKWFYYHYDDEYQLDVYKMIREKIKNSINIDYISITHTDISRSLSLEDNNIDFSDLWKLNRGTINHYTDYGNNTVYKTIKREIEKL